jgi:hypothetical protein
MNYTETFEEFSKSVAPMDLALYAGVGLVLWVVFKDKLSPVQKLVSSVVNQVKGWLNRKMPEITLPKEITGLDKKVVVKPVSKDDIFFQLVVSWKKTRDLAEQMGCNDAVKVADDMFPYLSPNVCGKTVVEIKDEK